MTHSTPWAVCRAFAITALLLFEGFRAAPFPNRVTAQDLRLPEARQELDRWMTVVDRLGLDLNRDDLIDLVKDLSGRGANIQKRVLKPFRPLIRITQTDQAWALFATPDSHPNRLEVRVRVDGSWQLVYRALDAEYRELAGPIEYRRVRGVHDLLRRESVGFKHFCEWVAGRLFNEHPDADAAEVRLVRLHTTLPGEPVDPTEDVWIRRVVSKDAP